MDSVFNLPAYEKFTNLKRDKDTESRVRTRWLILIAIGLALLQEGV